MGIAQALVARRKFFVPHFDYLNRFCPQRYCGVSRRGQRGIAPPIITDGKEDKLLDSFNCRFPESDRAGKEHIPQEQGKNARLRVARFEVLPE